MKHHLTETATRGDALLDFAVYGSNLEPVSIECSNSHSDHKILEYSFKLKPPTRKLFPKVPNVSLGKEITLIAFNDATNTRHFLENFENIKALHSNSLRITPRPRIRNNELINLLLTYPLDTNLLIKGYWK